MVKWIGENSRVDFSSFIFILLSFFFKENIFVLIREEGKKAKLGKGRAGEKVSMTVTRYQKDIKVNTKFLVKFVRVQAGRRAGGLEGLRAGRQASRLVGRQPGRR